jgi:hypothetical protein
MGGASAYGAWRGHGAAPGPRPTPGKTRLRRWPYVGRRGSGCQQALRGSCVHPGRSLVSAETAPRRFGSPATRFPNVPCLLRSGHAAGWPHRPGAAPWPRHAASWRTAVRVMLSGGRRGRDRGAARCGQPAACPRLRGRALENASEASMIRVGEDSTLLTGPPVRTHDCWLSFARPQPTRPSSVQSPEMRFPGRRPRRHPSISSPAPAAAARPKCLCRRLSAVPLNDKSS